MSWENLGSRIGRTGDNAAPHVPDELKHLELHGGSYRVTVIVPRPPARSWGVSRLRKDLRTDSLKHANILKKFVVQDFQAQIRAALEKAGVYRKRVWTRPSSSPSGRALARERGALRRSGRTTTKRWLKSASR